MMKGKPNKSPSGHEITWRRTESFEVEFSKGSASIFAPRPVRMDCMRITRGEAISLAKEILDYYA